MVDVALMVVYNDDSFMRESLESIKDKVNRVWFLVPSQTWNGYMDELGNQKVINIINEYLSQYRKWRLMRVPKFTQADTLNYGLDIAQREKLRNVMILDSDEIWDKDNYNRLIETVKNDKKHDVFACMAHTYFKSIKYRINPPQLFNPVIMVKNYVRFEHARRPNSRNALILKDVFYHHPSHVRTDTFMEVKIRSCSERDKISDWYSKVWLNWTPDMKDFHPTVPNAFHEVITMTKKDLPEILWKYLNM